jgi:hypothetical protein
MPTIQNSLGALCAWRVSVSSLHIAIAPYTYLSWLTYFNNHTSVLSGKSDPCHSIQQALCHATHQLHLLTLLLHIQSTSIRPLLRRDTVSIAYLQSRDPRLQPTSSTTCISSTASHQQHGLTRLLQDADRCRPSIAHQACACTAAEPLAGHQR